MTGTSTLCQQIVKIKNKSRLKFQKNKLLWNWHKTFQKLCFDIFGGLDKQLCLELQKKTLIRTCETLTSNTPNLQAATVQNKAPLQ